MLDYRNPLCENWTSWKPKTLTKGALERLWTFKMEDRHREARGWVLRSPCYLGLSHLDMFILYDTPLGSLFFLVSDESCFTICSNPLSLLFFSSKTLSSTSCILLSKYLQSLNISYHFIAAPWPKPSSLSWLRLAPDQSLLSLSLPDS